MELRAALDSIHSAIVFDVGDWSGRKREAWIYGIVCGWNDENYEEFKSRFGWSDETVAKNKQMHQAYKKAMEGLDGTCKK